MAKKQADRMGLMFSMDFERAMRDLDSGRKNVVIILLKPHTLNEYNVLSIALNCESMLVI
jgi:hypothetical protein